MKFRKLALAILVMSLIGGATAGASEVFQTWRGKQVRVTVNGTQLDKSGMMIDGELYVPVKSLSGVLQALIRTEPDAVYIDKPNAHLLMLEVKPKSMTGSRKVQDGKWKTGNYEFSVLVNVDNMRTTFHSTKVEIADPSGRVLAEEITENDDKQSIRKEFMYLTNPFKIHFKTAGAHKVRLFIKPSKDAAYELIGERTIEVEK